MDDKNTYRVYVGVMKLHKKYVGKHFLDYSEEFVSDINSMNSSFNSNFCNAMTDILRRWYIKGLRGIEQDDIAKFYTDLWRFHKKYLGHACSDECWKLAVDEARQLDKKYVSAWVQEFILAIMDDIEITSINNKNLEQKANVEEKK